MIVSILVFSIICLVLVLLLLDIFYSDDKWLPLFVTGIVCIALVVAVGLILSTDKELPKEQATTQHQVEPHTHHFIGEYECQH